MSRSSEITPGGAVPPLATVALLGAPPLIKGAVHAPRLAVEEAPA
jgi:hypothetical protein